MGQGKHASGGAKNYVVNGQMTRGFAFLAYPAEYANSGIMSFIVDQDGVLYQKDLGPKTAELANALREYDPDKTWVQSRISVCYTTPRDTNKQRVRSDTRSRTASYLNIRNK